MPGGGNGGALIGGAIVLVLLTMMTLDVFSGFWDTLMENKGPGARSRHCRVGLAAAAILLPPSRHTP